MNKLIIIIGLLTFNIGLMAQMQTVQLNGKKLQFDDGRQLPAEKAFIVMGETEAAIGLVKMQISDNGFEKNKILSETHWQRKEGDKSTAVLLPNHFKLRSGKNYDFRFIYYRKITENERQQLKEMLGTTANTLLRSNILEENKRYKFLISPNDIFSSLNGLIEEGMVNYETKLGVKQAVFSGITENMLQTLSKTKFMSDSSGQIKGDFLTTLQKQVSNEIAMFVNSYVYVIDDNIMISDYPVERTKNTLALNIGYGGLYHSGSFSDLKYFSGPYAGISFPLGNKAFNSRFWQNTSLSLGVFLKDFTSSDSLNISGPIVKRPFYGALGFRVFDYFKVQIGTAVIEEGNSLNTNKAVSLKPFVGLSFELNLWLGVGKK